MMTSFLSVAFIGLFAWPSGSLLSRYARQLMAATETVDNIKSVTTGNTPISERQTRPLARLDLEQQLEAWQ